MAVANFNENLYAVIMAGGKGTRFWPASRESHPKQLLPIINDEPMVTMTYNRIASHIPPERVIVVTAKSHASGIRAALPVLPPENILVEPVGRNTAPCIGLAAHYIRRLDPDGVMLVVPADHVIEKRETFLRLVALGAKLAADKQALITFGIKPDRPETGYGYIETHVNDSTAGYSRAISFREKPDRLTAEQFIATGRFYWNSGMFVWKAEVLLRWLERLLPYLAQGLNRIAPHLGGIELEKNLKAVYHSLPSISIDFGVMEKADGVLVLPADIGWNDVGSLSSAAQYWPVENQNSYKGDVVFLNSTGSAVYSPEKFTAVIGLKNIILVDTKDVLLVCAKESDQQVKKIVDILNQKGRNDLL